MQQYLIYLVGIFILLVVILFIYVARKFAAVITRMETLESIYAVSIKKQVETESSIKELNTMKNGIAEVSGDLLKRMRTLENISTQKSNDRNSESNSTMRQEDSSNRYTSPEKILASFREKD